MHGKSKRTTVLTLFIILVLVNLVTVGGFIDVKVDADRTIEALQMQNKKVAEDKSEEQRLNKELSEVNLSLKEEFNKSTATYKVKVETLTKEVESEKIKNSELSSKLEGDLAASVVVVEEEVKIENVEEPAQAPVAAAKSTTDSPQLSGRTMTVEATAYDGLSLGGVTATGVIINSTSDMIIAVDPSVIPLGSRVLVEGYGEAIAADTGGDIVGNRVDLNMSTANAMIWGRKSVQLTILN